MQAALLQLVQLTTVLSRASPVATIVEIDRASTRQRTMQRQGDRTTSHCRAALARILQARDASLDDDAAYHSCRGFRLLEHTVVSNPVDATRTFETHVRIDRFPARTQGCVCYGGVVAAASRPPIVRSARFGASLPAPADDRKPGAEHASGSRQGGRDPQSLSQQ